MTQAQAQTQTAPAVEPEVDTKPKTTAKPKAKAKPRAKAKPKQTPEQKAQSVMDKICNGLPTKSAKIRALDAKDYTRSQIAKYLSIRYQHVRNVLITPLKGKPA